MPFGVKQILHCLKKKNAGDEYVNMCVGDFKKVI